MSSASWKLADALFSQQPSNRKAIMRILFTLLPGDRALVANCSSTRSRCAWPAHKRCSSSYLHPL